MKLTERSGANATMRNGANAAVGRMEFPFIELLVLLMIAVVLLGGFEIAPLQLDEPMQFYKSSPAFDQHRAPPLM